jgi:hypothetical protein
VGWIYNWKVLGKEGQDRIPNNEFWSSLPGLVKDGILFFVYCIKLMVSKCTGAPVERPYVACGRRAVITVWAWV